MDTPINQLFANLDLWRHYPSYQLERRADAFFSVYLPGFLHDVRGYTVEAMIPEFPIRVGAVYPDASHDKSFKVDYLIKTSKPTQLLFIELKTDPASKRPEQDDYLTRASDVGMTNLLLGLKRICASTSAKGKYQHLLRALEAAQLVRILGPCDFDVLPDQPQISILYVQPQSDGTRSTIGFEELAEYVGKKQDELSQRFSTSLREWVGLTAGTNGT